MDRKEGQIMDWKMIIGGKSADASDGAVLNNYNPYTGELTP